VTGVKSVTMLAVMGNLISRRLIGTEMLFERREHLSRIMRVRGLPFLI